MTIQWSKSTCAFCGLGCGLMVGVEQGKVVEVKVMKGHPANDGDICSLPRSYTPMFYSEDRLKQPMIRRNDKLVSVDWVDLTNRMVTGTALQNP